MTDQITTHKDDALDRLLQQFADSSNLHSLISVYAGRMQGLEDAVYPLLELRYSIDSAEGEVLDRIGALLVLDRQGVSDTRYRALLKARIAATRAAGTASDFIELVRLLESDASFSIQLREYAHATAYLELQQPLLATDLEQFLRIMRSAKAAGVRLLIEVPETTIDESFTFAPSTSVVNDTSRGFEDATSPGTGGLLVGVYE